MLFEKFFGYGNATIDLLSSEVSNNPYEGMRKPGGIMNVAKGWKVLSQLQKTDSVKIYMVGNWGGDEYSSVIKQILQMMVLIQNSFED